ncbi:hypothetical protein BDV96DRAFT_642089 [Lophiotrema nucula]|uniref:Uncharacterized protein n=1 Tax=Lophiotrema nucula TaxID=690887 RepID=A0A6A5ZML1_9PLEO|nr:hypothetical protein BDV96DRAFT_642089 [Lophiotrema nucula]
MSASKNADAVSNQGEFHASAPGSEPLTQKGHKPGVLASESDRAPEFSAQTLPAGSAPADKTFQPSPDLNNQKMYQDASSTLTGADSADVHTGLGHPGQGQTSSELRHDGQHTSKHQGLGQVGLQSGVMERGTVDARQPENAGQRRLDSDVPSGQRGTVDKPGAEEAVPESAETVASEN